MQTQIIKTKDEFQRLRPQWDELLEASAHPLPFTTWEWLYNWWRGLGRKRKLHIMVFRDAEKLIAIAPLMRAPAIAGVGKKIEFLASSMTDYHDFLCLPGREREVAEAFLEWCAAHKRSWDLIDLHGFTEDSPFLPVFKEIQPPAGFVIEQKRGEPCPVVDLDPTWEEYLKRLGKKTRFNLNYYIRRMERDIGGVDLLRISDPEALLPAVNEMILLHTREWRKRRRPGSFFTAARRAFIRDACDDMLETDRLDFFRFSAAGKTVSSMITFRVGARQYYYIGGFDGAYSHYSPGTVLTGHAMKNAIEKGCVKFDFLRGYEPYKLKFKPVIRYMYQVEISHPAPGSKIARRVNIAQENLVAYLKNKFGETLPPEEEGKG